MRFRVAPERRLEAVHTDPDDVLSQLADRYPGKPIWGPDHPFQSHVAELVGASVSLRRTFDEEAACLFSLPEAVRSVVALDRLLALSDVAHESLLSPR